MRNAGESMCEYVSLQNGYEDFIRNHTDFYSKNVDFFGINLSNSLRKKETLKLYYGANNPSYLEHSLLNALVDLNMIKDLTVVRDTLNKGKVRYEIGLDNRTNYNMKRMIEWVESVYSFRQRDKHEIELMSAIKCSNLDEYTLAALYYLGIIATIKGTNHACVEAVKFHYILRQCKNPSHIGEDYVIDNSSALNQLKSIGVPQIEKISNIISNLVGETAIELWIAAIDFYTGIGNKYKIYVKNIDTSSISALSELLRFYKVDNLSKRIAHYNKWLNNHPELSAYGLALCLKSDGEWSANFYHNITQV